MVSRPRPRSEPHADWPLPWGRAAAADRKGRPGLAVGPAPQSSVGPPPRTPSPGQDSRRSAGHHWRPKQKLYKMQKPLQVHVLKDFSKKPLIVGRLLGGSGHDPGGPQAPLPGQPTPRGPRSRATAQPTPLTPPPGQARAGKSQWPSPRGARVNLPTWRGPHSPSRACDSCFCGVTQSCPEILGVQGGPPWKTER